jgi:predicted nucleic acid-binding protein
LPVVSDAGPLIHLAQIDKIHLARSLFGTVTIVEHVKVEVFDEGTRLGYPDAVAIGKALTDKWILVERFPIHLASVAKRLAEGESVSISDAETFLIAREKKAELLVDENVLSRIAKMSGLRVWSTWSILLESLGRNLIRVGDVESAIDELGMKKHRLKEKQAREILQAAEYIEKMKKAK